MDGHHANRRLYRYWDADGGMLTLRNQRVRVSRILELNDPFEFLSPNLRDRDDRKALRNLKRELNKKMGILCFSDNWKNPVMWAHYAGRYKGVCLGFDVAESIASGPGLMGKVKYVEERSPWPTEREFQHVSELLFTKFNHWNYEREWRVVIALDDCEKYDGHYFMHFSDDLALKEVYTGASSGISRRMVTAAIGGLSGVYISKTRAAFQTFEIVKNQGAVA